MPGKKKRFPVRNGKILISDMKYDSIFSLCEEMLDKNPMASFEEMKGKVLKHYKNSSFSIRHYYQYRSRWKRKHRSKRKTSKASPIK